MKSPQPFSSAVGKQRAEYKVTKHDSPETVQEQWHSVLRVLQDNNSAFLYHLENHYCLVFAARSWHMDAGMLFNICNTCINACNTSAIYDVTRQSTCSKLTAGLVSRLKEQNGL